MYIVEGTIPLREKEHIREMCICNDGESVNQKEDTPAKTNIRNQRPKTSKTELQKTTKLTQDTKK